MKQKIKQRKHHTLTVSGGNNVDHYPEIDQYIPDAVAIANAQHSKPLDLAGRQRGRSNDWTVTFLKAMDKILIKKGLRF